MSLPFLIYCSLLTKTQYASLRVLAGVNPSAVDTSAIDQAMRDAVRKRMELAQDFLRFSKGLVSPGEAADQMAARNAVSRAYYAAHHAMRALLLFEERGDVDGHREAIEAVYALLKRNPGARSRIGEADEFRRSVLDLLDQRHLADYYPYATNAPNEPPADFVSLAQTAMNFSRRVVQGTADYISLKESGGL